MPVQHRNLPDSELHEPKGVATAADNTVYLANGSGVGEWKRVPALALQGVNSGSVADRRVVTDGAGGFKLVSDGVFGQIVYDSGGPLAHNLQVYTAVTLQGVLFDGAQSFTTLNGGYYRVHFAGDTQSTPPGTIPSYQGFLTFDGSTPVGQTVRNASTADMTFLGYIGPNVSVKAVLRITGSSQIDTVAGGMTIEYLGG